MSWPRILIIAIVVGLIVGFLYTNPIGGVVTAILVLIALGLHRTIGEGWFNR
jgi:hypothetical protein